jgi:SOS-response transcriptional repressor LexA
MRRNEIIAHLLAGEIHVGEKIRPSTKLAGIPRWMVAENEKVYSISFAMHHFENGDLVIVEPRTEPHTGECVLVQDQRERVYIGRWWAKHKARELHVDPALKPMRASEISIVGVINFAIRV